MTTRPPEAPDWIEAPYPWDGVAATPPPIAPASPAPSPKAWGYKVLAGMVVLGLVGSLAGGALSARFKSRNTSTTSPTTAPFNGPSNAPFTPSRPNAPFTTTPNRNSASVNTDGIANINTSSTITGRQGAGTGMVLTASGDVLTNNHVVEGATRILVTTVKDGKTYTASVVGVSPTDDVALLRLSNAKGLTTVPVGTSSSVRIGDEVISAGNAGGRNGLPTVATGNVVALNQTIQVRDELDDATETLRGLIQTTVPLQRGESGGPMFDDDGKVIGINTAASQGFRNGAEGYAVPIDRALSIVEQIRTGKETDTIHIGVRGFLGVRTQAGNGGAEVISVQSGSPADGAGLDAGNVITAVDGEAVPDPSALIKKIREHRPGESVTITWTTSDGQSRSAKVTLAKGAAD